MSKKKKVRIISIENMIKYGSVLSIIWLFSFPTILNIIFSIALSLCAVMCLARGWVCLNDKHEILSVPFKTSSIIFTVIAVLGVCCFKRWSAPDSIILVPNMIINCSNIIIGIITLILSIGSFLFLLWMVSQYIHYHNRDMKTDNNLAEEGHSHLVYLFLTALITIALCSKSSILYPFNDAADGNCFLTVGKALINGKVLYRDIIEQKGPYIYFLHSLAAMVSEKTFLFVFVIEIISAFLFLCIIYKTVRLFNRNIPIGVIALFAALIFSQGGLFHGDEIEELCLPFLALTNYYMMRYVKKQILIHTKEMLVVGILAGCIFWAKYTICGYFACWYVIVAVHQIKNHRMKNLIECFFAGLGGVILSTIPVIIYFAFNNSLSSLWEVYFFANLFKYNNVNAGFTASLFSIVKNLVNGMWVSLRYNLANCIFLLCGVFWFRTRKEKILYTTLIGVAFLFICIGMSPQKYYTFIFAAFSAPGILFIWSYAERIMKSIKVNRVIPLVACAIISISISPNVYMLSYSQEELPQFRFAEIINTVPNATLLNYGFLDSGYYTTSGIVPNCRYFCKLNMDLEEQTDVQDYYVNNGLTEFVVSRDHRIDSEYYELCDSYTYFFENAYRTDYLYHLKHS